MNEKVATGQRLLHNECAAIFEEIKRNGWKATLTAGGRSIELFSVELINGQTGNYIVRGIARTTDHEDAPA